MRANAANSYLNTLSITTVVMFGIEAHVCVQQTCLDLLEGGKDANIITDSVSSQQRYDREVTLNKMAVACAYLTTSQSAAFMLVGSAEHANSQGKEGNIVMLFMVMNLTFSTSIMRSIVSC